MNALRAAAFAALTLTAGAVQAQPLANGDFSAGLAGWETLGDAALLGSAGGTRLWLSTASAGFEDDYPLPAGTFNRSGTAAVEVGAPGGVESFAGVVLGALDPDPDNGLAAYEGSVLRQSFDAAAGDTLSFRWNFATSDMLLPDYAFFVLDGQLFRLGGVGEAGWPGTGGHAFETGEQTFSLTLAGGGRHHIAFGVVDVGDYNLTSSLAVGQVQLLPVPEPGALGLMLVGLAALWRRGRPAA